MKAASHSGPLRLVLDTNILVSAFLAPESSAAAPSPPLKILNALKDGRFIWIVSDDLTTELLRVLTYPKLLKRMPDPERTQRAVGKVLLECSELVRGYSIEQVSPDPDDDVLIAVAQAAQATALVTGDKKDLLSLKLDDLEILSAIAAVERFGF